MAEPLEEIVKRAVCFQRGLDPDQVTVLRVEQPESDDDYWAPRPPPVVHLGIRLPPDTTMINLTITKEVVSDLEIFGADITITVRARAREGDAVTVLVHRVDPRCVTWMASRERPSRVIIDHFTDCLCGVPALPKTIIEQPSITCPKCHLTSYNPNDIEHRYCGMCGYHDGSLIK